MLKRSRSTAILEGKCPRCRQGNIFRFSLSKISRFAAMNADCPKCGLHFEREPGFFLGAMYISYAFSVAMFAFVGITLSLLGDFPLLYYFAGIILGVLLFFPAMFRYSRILFLHLFGGVEFDARYSN